ncbi:hypothetical protein [uncultured Methylobacterium sp.]|uniref:hypothetical protein n=1 Tax=uncultured Methylobacterium sp. TaxID=157278 RepID=UPI0035C95579
MIGTPAPVIARPIAAACAVLLILTCAPGIERACAQSPVAAPTAVPPATAAARTLNPLSALDPAGLGAFRGRPLFAPSRRPPPARPVEVAPPQAVAVLSPPPDLRLVGVVAGLDKAVAILRRAAGGASLNLKIGDSVDAWRVDTIAPDRVTLRDGERAQTYRLFTVGGSAPSAPPLLTSGVPQPGPRGLP